MRANRRPKASTRPQTAAELVLDLEARAPEGDPESAFEVSGEEWALLVQFAKRELQARRAPVVVERLMAAPAFAQDPTRAG